MNRGISDLTPGERPFENGRSELWPVLFAALDESSLLVAIEHKMGPRLRTHTTAEDVWADTQLRALASGSSYLWSGLTAFRNWLLTIAERVIQDLADHWGAAKRGGGVSAASLEAVVESNSGPRPIEPVDSETPSRNARRRERALVMQEALLSLGELERDIVRRRLFEGQSLLHAAEEIGIPYSQALNVLRRGCRDYYLRVRSVLSSRTPPRAKEN